LKWSEDCWNMLFKLIDHNIPTRLDGPGSVFFLADHNMPPPHYDFLIKVNEFYCALSEFSHWPRRQQLLLIGDSGTLYHTYTCTASEQPTVRCREVLPSPSFLRRCMDSFLYHNDWYRLQDPHDWTWRQSHQASDSASYHPHFALTFG